MARIETALSPTTEDEDSPARRLTLGLPNARFSDLGASAGASTPQSPAWPDQLSEQYDIQRVIGRGASSQVFAATHKSSGEKRAVKRIYKPKCCRTARATRRLRDEVRVLSSIRHRHIVEMREVFETPSELFVVMERCEGGELFDRIVAKGSFSEAEAATVMRQLLSALADCHRRGVLHRDVKPENLLLTSSEGWELKLSDFGLVKTLSDMDEFSEEEIVSPDSIDETAQRFRRAETHTLCGSPYYMAPEVCGREKYGPAVDVWSSGVVLFILLTGAPPWERPPQFGSAPDLDVGRDLGHVSSDAVDLILRMLRPFPGDRCTAQEALSHPWFKREERNRLSSPRYAPQLKLFQEKRKRRRDSAALDLTPMNRALPHIDKRGRSDDSKEPPLEYDTLSSDGSDYGGDEPPHLLNRDDSLSVDNDFS